MVFYSKEAAKLQKCFIFFVGPGSPELPSHFYGGLGRVHVPFASKAEGRERLITPPDKK
jgi:hypothetical protein